MPKYEGPEQVKITAEGKSYIFRPGEITPRIARKVRQTTGMALMKALQDMAETGDIDALSVVMYAAELQTDPSAADFEAIEDSFSYTSEIEVEFPTEEDGNPEP